MARVKGFKITPPMHELPSAINDYNRFKTACPISILAEKAA
jgi:hypothetical protein